jgi:4-hydroxy-4-methyl-2-oxoglutarate aldolase
MSVCVTNIKRPSDKTLASYQGAEVANIHESQGRKGLLASYMRPIYRPAKIAGTAITVSVAPGDNWMLHVAVEQCQPGDVLVVAPTSPCEDGYFGDLLATSLMSRGVVGLIMDGGVRDIAVLTEMGFPAWSKTIFAQGAVKETLGSVNIPVVCAGQLINPGDVIVADDDGVVVVRRHEADEVVVKSSERADKEEITRLRMAAGELRLDIFAMRKRLAEKGLVYLDQKDYQ